MGYVIGIDVGSQSVKAVLFDEDGNAVEEAAAAYEMDYPASGWAEQDPARWERGIAATVQHEYLHYNNVFVREGRPRIIDWGDSVISHPFASLVVTFQFLEQVNRLPASDAWFGRLRDAYLEPWGPGYVDTFHLALRVGTVAHAIAWMRQREALPATWLARFDSAFRPLLTRVSQLAAR